jgi:hypothetical protein
MEVLLGSIILSVLLAFPFYRILAKAGLNPAIAFVLFIPVLGYLIILGVLAFMEWPNEPAGYR